MDGLLNILQFVHKMFAYVINYMNNMGTAVAQWLRCCATFFIDIKSFRSHYGPGVDSAFNRNEYQEHFLVVKAVGA